MKKWDLVDPKRNAFDREITSESVEGGVVVVVSSVDREGKRNTEYPASAAAAQFLYRQQQQLRREGWLIWWLGLVDMWR